MQRAVLLALAFGAAPGAPGCDVPEAAAPTLAMLGRPSLRLVDAPVAARVVAAGAEVLQARGEESAGATVPGARAVRDGEPLAEAPAGRRFVVVSAEPELALRLGARLAREGAAQVAVVAGGLPAWGPPRESLEPTEE